MPRVAFISSIVTVTLGLAACSGMAPMHSAASAYDQSPLPEAVRVPAGHRLAWESVGVGKITYECRAKADMPGTFAWVFVGPDAALKSRGGETLGRYFGPPATWAANDGSAITGTQLAVAPGGAGNIPLQLVKANPATGSGTMSGVSYVQRVATRGGVAPTLPCAAASAGQREVVQYQADYLFWKPA